MNKSKSKILLNSTNILIVLLLILTTLSFFYLNSKIKKIALHDESRLLQEDVSPEEKSVRESFDESMNFRLVGNCDSFADSVSSSDSKIREEWGERCRREKVGETATISNITIKRLSIRGDRAFIQADIEKIISLGEKISYTGTYELAREDDKWKLLYPEK